MPSTSFHTSRTPNLGSADLGTGIGQQGATLLQVTSAKRSLSAFIVKCPQIRCGLTSVVGGGVYQQKLVHVAIWQHQYEVAAQSFHPNSKSVVQELILEICGQAETK